jgi:hypothetical protein
MINVTPRSVRSGHRKPETLRQAERWNVAANRAERLGLCRRCAGQYAWGAQIGFSLSHPPCPACARLIETLGAAPKPNGWRVLSGVLPTSDTGNRSNGPESRITDPVKGIDGYGQCRHCGEQWTGFTTCHCSACHMTFQGIEAFDRHRVRGHCADPATRGLIKITRPHWVGWGVL